MFECPPVLAHLERTSWVEVGRSVLPGVAYGSFVELFFTFSHASGRMNVAMVYRHGEIEAMLTTKTYELTNITVFVFLTRDTIGTFFVYVPRHETRCIFLFDSAKQVMRILVRNNHLPGLGISHQECLRAAKECAITCRVISWREHSTT